jgi:hypothetical protein
MMVNIWEYEYTDSKIVLTTCEGKVFEGYVVNVSDSGEYEDVYENPEDMLDLESEEGIFGFKQSEIEKIEKFPKIEIKTAENQLKKLSK